MKFILEVNNKTKQKISKAFFSKVFKRSMELAGVSCLKDKTIELSVALVEESEILVPNNQYRKKNAPTDVLSFCEYASTEEICRESALIKDQPVFIGELILCPSYIKKNADEDGESMEYALAYIVAHGILHLLGYEHGKKMFTLQKLVADQLKKL